MISRLQRYWVYGGALAALALLAIVPLLADAWGLPLLAVYLGLPVYMLHQLEEHDNNRFAEFLNAEIGNGHEVLTSSDIFWINIGGVWALDVAVLWLAARVGIGWGLIAVAVMLVNALVHIVQGIRLRKYNPGLVTAIVLFLPYGVWATRTLNGTGQLDSIQVTTAVLLAIALHAGILLIAFSRLRRSSVR